MAKLILELEGEGDFLEFGLDCFARANGWVEGNSISKIDLAKIVLVSFLRQQIQDYNASKIGDESQKVLTVLDSINAKLEVI